MQFLLKQTEKIAFADKKMLGNFIYSRDRAKIFVCIFESLRDERGEGRGAFGERVAGEANVVKKLGYEMVEYFLEGVWVAFSGIKIQLAKKLLKYSVSRDIYDLYIARNKPGAFYSVLFRVEKDVVPFVSAGFVYQDKMILKGADEHQISSFKLVFSVLYDVCGIAVHKI